jgi:succinoglycan biosynthesis transport protein ExoP
MTLRYDNPDPDVAARISNAWAEAYLATTLETKFETTRRAGSWLRERIDELRRQSLESDLAVQKFRAEMNLITSQGNLVTEQTLTQLNTELVNAKSDLANAEARYQRIRSIIDSGDADAAVTDALASDVINELRTKFLNTSKTFADLESRLGPDHIQTRRLAEEMEQYRRLIFEELSRIAASYGSDLEVARQRVDALQANVLQATGVSASANTTQVQLRELEREADTYRALYETFLQRYQELIQKQAFPISDAVVIAKAVKPDKPAYPSKSATVIQTVLLGLFAGIGIGAWRERRERGFRTSDQVRDTLGLRYLGDVPAMKSHATPISSDPRDLHRSVTQKRSTISNFVVDHPQSAFAETLRATKMALDQRRTAKGGIIVGVISALPGEGKSTVSINLAELLAKQGHPTLLIDGDLRRPGVSPLVAGQARDGIIEALTGTRTIAECCIYNPTTNLQILPGIAKKSSLESAELLGSRRMEGLLTEARRTYEYTVIDLPPAAPIVDVGVIASRVDAFIFVVEWGTTARRMVSAILRDEQQLATKCIGVILNKVDPKKSHLYQEFGTKEYYLPKFKDYYKSDRVA